MNEQQPIPVRSFWPILLAFAILLTAYGIVSTLVVSVLGLLLLLTAIIGWVWENRSEAWEAADDR